MTREKIHPGLPITLKMKNDDGNGDLHCWVEEVRAQTMLISAPLLGGSPVLLNNGVRVTLTFRDKVCAYELETTIKGRISHPLPAYEVNLPDKFSRVQRRDYVRIDASFPIAFQLLAEDNNWTNWQNGVALDISGGGIRFLANKGLPANSSLKLRFNIDTGEIDAVGRICRAGLSDHGGYAVSVQFLNITKQARDKIIRYVFEQQRTMRQKGLI